MKVLLVNPPIPAYFYNREFYFPSSLLYLASVLRKNGDEPKILDFKTFQRGPSDPPRSFYDDTLIRTIAEFHPDLIGFGSLFSGNFPDLLRLTQMAKQHYPEIPNVIGGIHSTLYTQEILAHCPSIDSIVLGEGEETLVGIIEAMKHRAGFEGIDGLAFRKAGTVVIHPKTTYIHDVDALPLPAYDLIRIEDYHVDTSGPPCPSSPAGAVPIGVRSVPCTESWDPDGDLGLRSTFWRRSQRSTTATPIVIFRSWTTT